MLAGTMEGFFKLVEQYRTQDEPAFCGLASLAMVLNTLSIDPRRTWKGPWRWFHEEMLDCCHPLSKVREEGITLEQAACLARCNGSKVEMYLYGEVGVGEFRDMVREACSVGSQHIIVSYSRKEFLQTGDGHFSPVGGYSEAHDMVLILDTARFKYPPHWVPLTMLYNAMAREDPVTGKSRGFIRLGTHPRLDSVLFTIDLRDPKWEEAHQYIEQQVLGVVREAASLPGATPASVLGAAAAGAPLAAVRQFMAVRTAGNSCNGGVCTQERAIELFLKELRGMPIYSAVAAAIPPQQPPPQRQAAATHTCAEASAKAAAHAAGKAAIPGATPVTTVEQQQQQYPSLELAIPGSEPPKASPQQPSQAPSDLQPLPQPQPQAAARSAATSSHAVAASSCVNPAVQEDVTPERLCMLLMMAPRDVWQEVIDGTLRHEVLNWLDTAAHKVVAAEAEYLQGQFMELQALRQAAAQQPPADATCGAVREGGVAVGYRRGQAA